MGWERIWDRVLDLPNKTIRGDGSDAELRPQGNTYKQDYRSTHNVTDLSTAFLGSMEHAGRGAALVALAVLFFIAYWMLAGPVSFIYLRYKKRTEHGWVLFALCALGATALTGLLVRLALRGSPQVKHVSFVQVAPDGNAIVQSRIGLYIPRNGAQSIALADTLPKRASYIMPYPLHPQHASDSSAMLAYLEYEVPLRDRTSSGDPQISIPFRSTLKKLQARWVGQLGGISGRAVVNRDSLKSLSGTLTNNSGVDLQSVWLVYHPTASQDDDAAVRLTERNGLAWPKGASIDLGEVSKKDMSKNDPVGSSWLNAGWMKEVFGVPLLDRMDAVYSDGNRAAVLLSIFDRLAPVAEEKREEAQTTRFELLRRAGRQIDASGVISAGALLILARSADDAPLPLPLRVGGSKVGGEGVVYYQFIVPLERTGPATQPFKADEDK